MNDIGHFLIFTVLRYSDGGVDLSFHSLELSLLLDSVPVSRLGSLISDLLWFLVRLSILSLVKHIRVVDWQIPRLLLGQVTILIFVDLDLPLDLFQNIQVHICRRHEAANPALELQLLHFIGCWTLILLFYLSLHMPWQPLHVSHNLRLLGALLLLH